MENLLAQFDISLHSSLLLSLALAFAGGLLASLTPCIYPMLPITAGIIAHANVGGSRWRGFLLSLLYVLGMALTYTSLGLFAAASGQFFGAINSNPWTFLVVGNIFLFFGLGMLDVIALPFLVGNFTSKRNGFAGIFLAGVSASLVAAPCTTPVLGSLLAYISTSGSLLAGGLMLFVFSLGMGVLLLAVGTCSSFLAALPRSGIWMVRIKKAMGLVMLALAEYFFIQAGALFL
jgi:cytochrome c-type biogenesis protein